MTTFEITALIMMGLTLLGVGSIGIWIFKWGRWTGMVDTEILDNREDHKRYEDIFRGMA